ncbi:MAG TPA: di-heme oxidoredictase family protein [Fluviicola sp.]|nr:di-heme oxidoredictase family protein [Fluviicola sp.]
MRLLIFSAGFLFLISSCKKNPVIEEFDPATDPAAGSCTVYDQTSYAFSYQVNGLTSNESLQFYVGNSFFNQNWVEAPSSTEARDGLGPLFNAKSCAGCHFRDGRGMPIMNEGLLFRLGTPDNNFSGAISDILFGGQLQDQAISGVPHEGQMTIQYAEITGYYPDGGSYTLRVPTYSIGNQQFGALGSTTRISPRVGQQMIGLGLLEQIPDARLLALADPFDGNGDGISGRVNYVSDLLTQGISIGRFGWKANVPTLYQQVAGAFNGDIGITSSLFLNENHTAGQTACNGLPNGGTPEISDEDLASVVLYSRVLAVPAQRNANTHDVMQGKQLFKQLNCTGCHIPTHVTGSGGNIQALKNVRIHPYTDLLLHDMGGALADGLPNFKASGSEWRTPPLWGLGLIQTVNGHTFLLHDGRARSIEEAILWHGGEAERSKNKFKELSKKEREQVLRFLESL